MADNTNNPGDPNYTDPEATSPEQAEAAAEGAFEAQDLAGGAEAAAEGVAEEIHDVVDPEADEVVDAATGTDGADLDPELDPELEAELAEVLDGVDTDLPDADAQAEDPVAAQLAERTEDLQRVTAEYTNYRRRVERDRVAVIDGATADVAAKLLPILDDLDMAEQHGDLNGPLKAISDKLAGVFNAIKVEAFGQEGDAFDPELHEAVQDLSSGDDKVLGQVLRKGYRMGDRVLRNAMVIIADPS